MILKYSWVFGKTKSIEYSLEIIKGKLYFSYRMLMDFIKTQEKLNHSHDFLRHGKENLNLFHSKKKSFSLLCSTSISFGWFLLQFLYHSFSILNLHNYFQPIFSGFYRKEVLCNFLYLLHSKIIYLNYGLLKRMMTQIEKKLTC